MNRSLDESSRPLRRWDWDPIQWLVAIGVGIIIAGQVVTLTRAVTEPRPRGMKVAGGRTIYVAPPVPAAALPQLQPLPATPPAPPVLNRMLRIQKIQRRQGRDGIEVTIEVRAQVSERVFDVAAAVVQVEWREAGMGPQTMTLPLPANWGNFSARTFLVRFPGNPAALQGCTVRSYYRGQLQDQREDSPSGR